MNLLLDFVKCFLLWSQPIPVNMKTSLSILLLIVIGSITMANPGKTVPQSAKKPSEITKVNGIGALNVHRQHNAVAISWTATSANITKFLVQRSYDGDWFEVIGEQTMGNGHWNRFQDKDVTPGFVYYKVTAIMTDGTTASSSVEMIRIVRHAK